MELGKRFKIRLQNIRHELLDQELRIQSMTTYLSVPRPQSPLRLRAGPQRYYADGERELWGTTGGIIDGLLAHWQDQSVAAPGRSVLALSSRVASRFLDILPFTGTTLQLKQPHSNPHFTRLVAIRLSITSTQL